MESWVGFRAGLEAVVKRKIPSPSRDMNPRSSSPQPSAIPLSHKYVGIVYKSIVIPTKVSNYVVRGGTNIMNIEVVAF
jgi:hypothetical protein